MGVWYKEIIQLPVTISDYRCTLKISELTVATSWSLDIELCGRGIVVVSVGCVIVRLTSFNLPCIDLVIVSTSASRITFNFT